MVKCATWISWGPGSDAITLFDERDGSYHALNRTATAIWMAIDEGMDPAQASEVLAASTGAPLKTIRDDVDAFVAGALGKGLLVCD